MRKYTVALPQISYDTPLSQGTLSLLQPALTLFDNHHAMAVLTTKVQNPDLLEEVGRLRCLSFQHDAQITGESSAPDSQAKVKPIC